MLPAPGQAADDIESLRAELQALKSDYTARVSALETRIEQLESAPAVPATAEAVPQQPAPAAGSAATAFNPAISVILGGSYTDTSQDPESWTIGGFIPSGGEVGPGERSFNLGESELALSANVDPYFSAMMIAAITAEDEIEVEEAYFRTLALPSGFTAKGGRFFSGFGYLNEVHAHAWDFVDQPLVYQAFFGGQYKQDGVQLKWLAPTDLFVELGAETGNGDAFPATRRNRNGMNGATLFAHIGGDVGDSTSWRAGAAWIDQRAEDRSFDDDGRVRTAGRGFVHRQVAHLGRRCGPQVDPVRQCHAPAAQAAGRVHASRRGRRSSTFDAQGLGLSDAYRSEQSGWYVQGVFQFLPRWRAALRYDALDSGSPHIGLVTSGLLSPEAFPTLLSADPERISIMLDWNPSEFSRLRAQYDWDDARAQGDRDRVFRLQYLFGIGAHGAHKY